MPSAKKASTRFTGWRGGVLACVLLVACCVLIEIALLVVAVKLNSPQNGLGTMYHGSCARVENLSNYLLIPLNALGTITLSSSNYVMQILNAPDRQEIEKAHQSACFLNVGISSPSNLGHISRLKRTLYGLLALSTVPIHLMLNSAVFASLQANNYGVMIVSQEYATDPTWDANAAIRDETTVGRFVYDLRDSLLQGKIDFANHSAKECIQTYGNNLQSTALNVVLVTTENSKRWANLPASNYTFPDITKPPSNATYKRPDYDVSFSLNQADGIVQLNASSSNNFTYNGNRAATGLFLQPDDPLWAVQSLRAVFNAFDFRYWMIVQSINYNFNDSRTLLGNQWEPASWICGTEYALSGKTCSQAAALQNASSWEVTPSGFEIDHCLITSAEESCTLQYSLPILISVLICEVVKLASMLFTLHLALTKLGPDQEPLATIGDAIASFLTTPEATTKFKCLVSQKHAHMEMGIRSAIAQECLHLRGLYAYYEEFKYNPFQQECTELPQVFHPEPLPWRNFKSRWGAVASKPRWVMLGSL
jgi:hypothetical protein